jgi:hypothetical protein
LVGQLPVVTCRNYDKWEALMKVKLGARNLWRTINVGTEDEDCGVLEAIMSAIRWSAWSRRGSKHFAKLAWDALKAMRVWSHRVKKVKRSRFSSKERSTNTIYNVVDHGSNPSHYQLSADIIVIHRRITSYKALQHWLTRLLH